MNNFLITIFLVLITVCVNAAEIVDTRTVELPTTRTDGSTLVLSDISEVRLYTGVDIPVVATGSNFVSALPETTINVTMELAPRAEPYVVEYAATVVDNDGRESVLSNVIVKNYLVGSTAPPSSPTLVNVVVSCSTNQCVIEEVIQ